MISPASGQNRTQRAASTSVSVRRIAFLPDTFGRCGKVATATAVKAYGY
jgi:hypothetical protein